jgi:hypothetical protein
LLLGLGLVTGVITAFLAIAPGLRQRGVGFPLLTVAVLATGMLVVAAVVSSAAVTVVRRLPVLLSLRSE